METRFNKNSPEYRAWYCMLMRCYNPKIKGYKDYGGRGITVCERWIRDYPAFLKDMGTRPTQSHSLERIENDKGYSPENCRWATKKEQQNNRRNNVQITHNGQTKTISQWADDFGVTRNVMYARYQRGHFPLGAQKR